MVPRRTIVLLALALVMLAAALRFGPPAADTRTQGDRAPVPGFSPDAATEVRVGLPDGGAVALARRADGAWHFRAPDFGRADARRVSLVLDAVFGGRVVDRITPRQREARGLDEADFGFSDKAEPWVEAVDAAGKRARLRFGSESPSGESVFAMRETGGDVLVLNRAARDLLPASRDDLRDRVLFDFDGAMPTVVEIRRPDSPMLRLEHSSGSSGWDITSPYRCQAEPSAVSALFQALVSAVAERFVWTPGPGVAPADAEKARAAAGLGPSETRVTLSLRSEGSPDPVSFAFAPGNTSGRAVGAALSDGTIFEVDSNLLDALLMPADILRDRAVFRLGAEACRSLSFSGPAGSVALERADAESPWVLAAPSPQPADQDGAQALVEALLGVRDSGAEPAPVAFTPPVGAVRAICAGAEGAARTELWFWRDGDGTARAWSPERAMLLAFPAGAVPDAALDPAAMRDIRSLTVVDIPEDSVVSLSIVAAGRPAGAVSVRRRPGGAWAPGADAPAGAVPDPAALSAALAAMHPLQATAVLALASADSAAYGLLPPRAELVVSTVQEPGGAGQSAPVVVLQFGAAADAEAPVPVRVKGGDAVFAVDPAAAAVLCHDFFETPRTTDEK